jgi:hypothetical protein
MKNEDLVHLEGIAYSTTSIQPSEASVDGSPLINPLDTWDQLVVLL